MKKFLALMLMLPMLMLVSCSDDDLPDVTMKVAYSGATSVDGTLYVVQDSAFTVTGLYVEAVNSKHNAAISGASYYWDFIPAGSTIVVPFAARFDTSLYSVGPHQLQIVANVLEEDCTPAVANMVLNIQIVESADDIPQGVVDPAGEVKPAVTINSK